MKRKLLWLDVEVDAAAIQTIKERYGCESESQAMRLALRVLANSPMLEINLPPRPPHARSSPKDDALEAVIERSAYDIFKSEQPSMLRAIGELLDKGQSPEEISRHIAANRDPLLINMIEIAATFMAKNDLRS